MLNVSCRLPWQPTSSERLTARLSAYRILLLFAYLPAYLFLSVSARGLMQASLLFGVKRQTLCFRFGYANKTLNSDVMRPRLPQTFLALTHPARWNQSLKEVKKELSVCS